MAALSLVFLGVVVADLVAPAGAAYRVWLDRASLAIWSVFLLEFLVKLAIAPARWTFLRRSWFDILVLAVPMLRILRAVRALRAVRGFRALRAARTVRFVSLFRLGSATRRGARALGRFLRASRFGYVSAVTAVVAVVGAAAALLLERDAPDAQIRTLGDALWWSAALITTVGGDLHPVTAGGRMLAVVMMLYSVVVFGYLVSQAVAFIQPPRPAGPAGPARAEAPGPARAEAPGPARAEATGPPRAEATRPARAEAAEPACAEASGHGREGSEGRVQPDEQRGEPA